MVTDTGWIPTLSFAKDKKGVIKKNEFDSELLPKSIIISKYFDVDNKLIDSKSNELNNLISEFDSIVEENTGDESLFNEDDKVNEKALKDLKKESSGDDLVIVEGLLKNLNTQKNLKKEIKEKQESLNENVISKYKMLNEDECKNIIVYDKWFKSIKEKFELCMNNLVNSLSNNIVKLDDEYELTLSDINKEIDTKEKELAILLKELVGDSDDMKAFDEFINQLGGVLND